ncbi:hypothetical protein [Bacillus wiedmannii]|uniref:hypothetical protein n=1 Tax=Bacillus wiedmannii TaxID=1890302 RepID=UPI000BF6AC0F|nr:hypothetical protein [Bacillus wiedmannii]PFZ26391.1 hypothetical protein COL51_15390 [Bacillus wiedmannii]PGC52310.1 hypothetical protein COM22_25365 [Bacillus wiedmannii]
MTETNPIPFTIQQFIFKRSIYEENTIIAKEKISCEVPQGYKIIGGGWYYSDTISPPPYIYPKSITEMVAELKYFEINNEFVWFYVITLFDPSDDWDVTLFNESVTGNKSVRKTIPEDYLLTSGWVSFNAFDHNEKPLNFRNLSMCMTGILSSYPVDMHTWEVEINDIQADLIKNWDLTVWIIGIKSKFNNKLQTLITIQEDLTYNIAWFGNVLTSGGIKLSPPSEGTQKFTLISNCYPVILEDNFIPKSWNIYWQDPAIQHNLTKFSKYAVGIKGEGLKENYLPPIIE